MPGVTILRYQDSATEVEIETDAGDSGSWTDEDTVFNSNGLITSDAVYLSENGSSMTLAGTGYTYQSDTGRYDNGAPTWGKITDISYPDSSWEHFVYDDDSGWLIDDYTPYKNTASTALSSRRTSITVMMRASREMAISPIRSC